MFVCVEDIFITGMAEALMPEETFSVCVQAMNKEFRFDGGKLVKGGPKGTDVTIRGIRRISGDGGWRGVDGKKERRSIAEAAVKNARDGEIGVGAEFTMGRILKSTSVGTFPKSRAGVVTAGY